MIYLNSLDELSDEFEAFIFDVYGVMHNGIRAIPETLSFLKKLQERGKTVSILSNAPFRTQSIVSRLQEYGLGPSLYQHILTGGEETRRHLMAKDTPQHARLGSKCYFLGLSEMSEILQDTGVQKCSAIEEADFILAAGPNEWGQDPEDYEEILDLAFKRELPMVCANPDIHVFKERTKRLRGGRLAENYENKGGEVIYHGKPYKSFYKPILEEIKDIPREKILCLGDSFQTDIKGAHDSKLSSVLVLSPLTYDELGLSYHETKPNKEERKNIFKEIEKQVYTPNYVIQLSA